MLLTVKYIITIAETSPQLEEDKKKYKEEIFRWNHGQAVPSGKEENDKAVNFLL